MNKNIVRLLAVLMMCFALVSVLVACGEQGPEGPAGKSPYVGDDGYIWVYDDAAGEYKKTEYKAVGEDGKDLTDCEDHVWSEHIIEKSEHSYNVATGESTNGIYLRVCDNCGDAEWFEGVIHDFENGNKVTVPATCTKDSYTRSYCKCGYFDEKMDVVHANTKLGHDWVDGTIVPATCTTDGFTPYSCSRDCGEEGATGTKDPTTAFGHAWDNGAVTDAATCTTTGTMLFTCTHDSAHTRTEEIEALGHDTVYGTPVAATCLKVAYTPYSCSRNCGEEGATGEREDGPKLDHAAAVAFDPANIDACWTLKEKVCICVEDQVYTSVCVNGCGETLTETIKAIGQHTFTGTLIPAENQERVPACKWSQPMLDYCTVCKDANFPDCEYYHIMKYLDPAPHDWSDATCTTPKTCKTCGDVEGEALGHEWNNATCTDPKTCKICNVTEGEALGHDYDKDSTVAVLEVPTLTSEGKFVIYCDVCGEVAYTATLPALSENNGYVKGIIKPKNEDESEKGCLFYIDTYTYTIVLDGNRGSITLTAFEVPDQHKHSDMPSVDEMNKVVGEDGTHEYYCYVCEHCGITVLVPVESVGNN